MYNPWVAYIWDEAKRQSNLQKHKLDFADAYRIFEGITFTFEDERFEYDEPRYVTIGQFKIIVVIVVHADRNGDVRIISMRKASRHEQKLYRESF